MIVYCCDVGILLTEEHAEFENYSQVYDKKHGFYDENQIGFLNQREAIEYGRAYVAQGGEGTYAVISNQGDIYRGVEEVFDEGNIEGFSYDLENVVYSARKNNGEIEENFLIA